MFKKESEARGRAESTLIIGCLIIGRGGNGLQDWIT